MYNEEEEEDIEMLQDLQDEFEVMRARTKRATEGILVQLKKIKSKSSG